MKLLPLLFAAGMTCIAPTLAADPPKPLLTITAKTHVLDSERDLRGKQGNTRHKSVALRVEILNATSATVAESELSGDFLITRSNDMGQKVVRESLGSLKVPELKPNGKVTLELGHIQISEVETRLRKMEEVLEEWKVTCTQNGVEIGKAVSSARYDTLEKQIPPPAPKRKPPGNRLR